MLSSMLTRSRLVTAVRIHRSSRSICSVNPVILALESSADDTCCAILRGDQILSNVVIKQHEIHAEFGGIHPLHAQTQHQRNMPLAISKAISEAAIKVSEIEAIAYTQGPGMFGCLTVSATSAKALSAALNIPIVGVHHMQAHALTPFLTEANPPTFPFLTLLVSGGHTLLLLARSESNFQILANTGDESIGGSFDKAARDLKFDCWSLGNGSPGAGLEKLADFQSYSPSELIPTTTIPLPHFPIPFHKVLAFSFSGIRSALDRHLLLEKVETMSVQRKRDIARLFMSSAISQLEEKVVLGIQWFEKEVREGREKGVLTSLVCSGGVASNMYLRERLRKRVQETISTPFRLIFPPPALCTDNAAMIGYVGLSRIRRGRVNDITNLVSKAKWSIEECEAEFEKDLDAVDGI